MKKMKSYKLSILLVIIYFSLQPNMIMAQDDTTSTPIIKLHYFSINNSMQYLLLESTLKRNKVFTPQKNKTYNLFLDSSNEKTFIAKVLTNEEGKAKAFIPPTLKTAWDAAAQHTFIVKDGDEEVISDYIITKTKISIDTTTIDSVRSIAVSVMKLKDNEWVPAKDAEMKIGIERQGSILSAGDEETYTTDSTGIVTVELKKNNLPGDAKGNYVLAARIDDNDELGNILIEKTVPWGTVTKVDNTFFNQRTLWTTRFKTPFWLLFIAYSIVIGVWGTIIYLVLQIIKIKKLSVKQAAGLQN